MHRAATNCGAPKISIEIQETVVPKETIRRSCVVPQIARFYITANWCPQSCSKPLQYEFDLSAPVVWRAPHTMRFPPAESSTISDIVCSYSGNRCKPAMIIVAG